MVRGWRWVVLCGVCVVTSACTRESRPNILLIVIDTLRADRLGPYGNRHGLTPFLDELAARGTVFLNAFSTASYTNSSVASLFTSRYPSQLHIAHYESKIADAEVMLAEELGRVGYSAAGFMANPLVSAPRGFAQGFELWWLKEGPKKVRAPTVHRMLNKWLDRAASGGSPQPTFLYLHYLEPHAPYLPSEANRRRFERGARRTTNVAATFRDLILDKDLSPDELELLESLYDAEVAGLDEELQLAFAELDRRGVLKNAIVVVTADHGEAFKEHGQLGHGKALYNELIHVPLIIVAPGYPPGVVREAVSLVDVAPTLLDLVGVEPPPSFEGRSLVALLTRSTASGSLGDWLQLGGSLFGASPTKAPEAQNSRLVIAELERLEAKFDLRRHATAVIHGSKKILVAPSGAEEVYDLHNDPHERTPHRGALDAEANDLKAMMHTTRTQLRTRASAAAERMVLDDATKETLRALGYQP